MPNRLRKALESGGFVVTCEAIPGRGACESTQAREFEEAVGIYETGRIHAISITDNPGGNPALLADTFARDFHERGIETLVHFTCKDKSRNQIQSQMYSLERQGLYNILVMTGDYQYSGWRGRSRPVFDLDPIQVLQMVHNMNEGLAVRTPRGEIRETGADFYPGAVISPFKWTEAETVTQYLKLEKKILAGARYIISQLGYDVRKMEELVRYVRERGYSVPLIANVYVISAGIARFMKGGNIPGCFISDEFLGTLTEEAKADGKGKAARILRAAKMVTVARGLGYAGVHIGGVGLNAQVVTAILDAADEIQENWREWVRELQYGKPNGFYLYEPEVDSAGTPTGLNAPVRAPLTEQYRSRAIMKGYGLSRFFHHWVLTQDKRFFKVLARVMDRKERKKGTHRHHGLEHLGKTILYGCMDCGDCGLEPAVYSCPMTQCPKCQRNGPCGGSVDGWCEVYPNERYCIYFKAYYRLKKYGELHKLDSFITPPNNWDYYETSGWSNYTHERDNTSARQFLPPPDERPEAARSQAMHH